MNFHFYLFLVFIRTTYLVALITLLMLKIESFHDENSKVCHEIKNLAHKSNPLIN